MKKPTHLTMIGSCREEVVFPIKAITRQYVIVCDNDGEERVYQISNGRSLTGTDWYYVAKKSLYLLQRFVKLLT